MALSRSETGSRAAVRDETGYRLENQLPFKEVLSSKRCSPSLLDHSSRASAGREKSVVMRIAVNKTDGSKLYM